MKGSRGSTGRQAHVDEGAGEEPRVEQVQDGVLDTADVLIHRHEVRCRGRVEGSLGVPGVAETQEVPRRVDERVHGVRLSRGRPATNGTRGVKKPFVERQRRLAGRKELDVIGSENGQLVLGYGHDTMVGAVNGRNGATPKTLARDQPVAEPVVDLALADAFVLEPFDRVRLRRLDVEPVQEATVDLLAFTGVRTATVGVPIRRWLHGAHDGKAVDLGEGPVPLILGRHSHNGAGAVPHQDVVSYIDRNRDPGERVQHTAPRKCPALVERGRVPGRGPLDFGFGRRPRAEPLTSSRWASVVRSSTSGCSGATTA